jgi:hypothetical protein
LYNCQLEKEQKRKYVDQLIEYAENGYVKAQHTVGQFYRYGFNIDQSYEKANFWTQKASDGGCRESQFILGYCIWVDRNKCSVEQLEKAKILINKCLELRPGNNNFFDQLKYRGYLKDIEQRIEENRRERRER